MSDTDPAPEPTPTRRRRRRHGHRQPIRRPQQTWVHLIMAGLLLGGILAFWGQLATGAAACFSSLAPPPETTTVEPTDETPRRQIQIKRVPAEP